MAENETRPVDDDTAAERPSSFFADRLAETHDPYRFPAVSVVYDDGDGPYEVVHRLVITVPDDEQVAELDDAGSALAEIEVLAGDDFDDLVDVLDEIGWSGLRAADELLGHFGLAEPPEAGWVDLVERLNLYGPALEFDLLTACNGLDLLDWFRGRWSWDHLLRIASRLPPGSHYRSAMADDDELAAQIAEVHGPPSKRPKRSRPALEGFTTEVSYLHRIANRLDYLGWATFAAQAGKRKGRPPAPAKGPETADDRFEWADYMREHEDVASRVLVRKGGSKRRQAERQPPPEAVRGAVELDPPAAPDDRPPP